MRAGRVAIACALALVLFASPLSATLTVPTDLPDVIALSTLIIRGRVTDTRAFTDIANGPITTAVTVQVTDVLKGVADRAVTFRAHGGEIGRYRQVMVGAPVFAVGEDAYLFLKRAADGTLWTVGMGAGVYIVADSPHGAVVTAPVVAGVTATAGAPVTRGDARRAPMGTNEFAGVVKLILSGGITGTGGPTAGGGGGAGRGGAIRGGAIGGGGIR